MADTADPGAVNPGPAPLERPHADGHPTVPADESIARAQGRPLPSERFAAGDPLRAIAAVSVLVYHAAFGAASTTVRPIVLPDGTTAFAPGSFGVAQPVLENLHLGLYVFFVLSGYLLARPFIRAFIEGDRRPRFGGYLFNRILRIVPAFWFAAAISLFVRRPDGYSADDVASVFLFAQNYDPSPAAEVIGQAWTLDVEMAFYLLLPLSAWLVARGASARLDRRGRIAVLLCLAAAVYGASLSVRAAGPDTFMFQRSLPAMLFAFIPGIVLATLEVDARRFLRGRRVRPIAWIALGVALVLLAGYTQLGLETNGARALLASLGTGALVAAPLLLQWGGLSAPRPLDNGPMRWLGERSYSFYLFHFVVGLEISELLLQDDMGSWERFAVVAIPQFVVTTIVAATSFRLVEVPFLRLRTAWRGRGARAVPGAPGLTAAPAGASEES